MSATEATGTARYGQYYFCVRHADTTDIFVMADEVEVTAAGALLLKRRKEDSISINLALAAGAWTHVYAASLIDGAPVAVEDWESEGFHRE